MAKKNEVLLSIALEGDQDVKAKLQAVGEAGKKSLQATEKTIGDARNAAERIGEPIGKVREALAPIIEQGGIAGALGGAGLGGIGGLISRLASGFVSPAGLVAGITGALVGLAKLGEETDKTKARLKAFGGGDDAFGKLTDQAKQLGTDVGTLAPGFERFQTYRRELLAKNRYSPIFEGGAAIAPATDDNFLKAQGALLSETRVDKTAGPDAKAAIGQFFASLFDNKQITTEAVKALQSVSPTAANFVARSVPGPYGQSFKNADELVNFTDRGGRLQPNFFISSLARNAPKATADAEAARGVTDAFEGLEAATKRLTATMGGDHANLTKGLDEAAGYVDKATVGVDRLMHAKDYQPGGGKFIGPVRPEDVSHAPQSLGEVWSSNRGDLLGRFVGYLRNSAATGTGTGATDLTGGNPFGVISDFLKKAVTDPGAITDKRPQQYPTPIEQLAPTGRPPSGDPNSQYDWQIAPARPPAPSQPATPENQQRIGQAEQPQQVAGLSSIIQQVLESISAAAYNANKPDLKVNEPASGGIRGEAEQPGTAVGDASQSITTAGDKLAAALEGVTALIERVQGAGSPTKVQVAAGGGSIRRLDFGGHVSGPGTSTSDSIPAMLSDGEYVIKAKSARKIGRNGLDWLNAGAPGLAAGGDVTARRLAKVNRFATGGYVDTAVNVATRERVDPDDLRNHPEDYPGGHVQTHAGLGPGEHEIAFDYTNGGAIIDGVTYFPGHPILDDPIVQKGIAESKAAMNQPASKSKYKSDFVGRFGEHAEGGPIGHFAEGGAVGNLQNYLTRHFAGGGQVSLPPQLTIGSPAMLDGGLDAGGGVPTLNDMGAGSEALHPVTLDFGSRQVGGLRAAPSALNELRRAARDHEMAQTGPAPSWYK